MATRSSVARFDAGSFRRDPATGDLHAKVNPTKAGVFIYRNPDGTTRRELRSRAEVHKADSMALLNWKPLTNDHPVEGGKLVLLTPAIADKHRTGIVFDHQVAEDGLHTEAKVIVTDKRQAALIESGKRSVSCGYDCEEDLTPGVDPEFGPYDLAQINIQYNHLAVVSRGRAGPGAQIRADGSEPSLRFDAEEIDDLDQPQDPEQTDPNKQEKPPMEKMDVDGHQVEVSESAKIAITNRLKADAAAIQTAEDKAVQARKDADTLKAKLDEATEKIQKYDALEAKRRSDALAEKLGSILGKDYKFDGKSDADVQRDALAKLKPSLKLDGQSTEYVAARLDAALEDQPAADPVLSRYDRADSRSSQATEDPVNAAYQKQIQKMKGEA